MSERYQVVEVPRIEEGPNPSEQSWFRIKDSDTDDYMPGGFETRDLAQDECDDLNAKLA